MGSRWGLGTLGLRALVLRAVVLRLVLRTVVGFIVSWESYFKARKQNESEENERRRKTFATEKNRQDKQQHRYKTAKGALYKAAKRAFCASLAKCCIREKFMGGLSRIWIGEWVPH